MPDKKFIPTSNAYHKTQNVSKPDKQYKLFNISFSPYDYFVKINGIIYSVSNSNYLIGCLTTLQPLNTFALSEPKAPLDVLNKTTLDDVVRSIAFKELYYNMLRSNIPEKLPYEMFNFNISEKLPYEMFNSIIPEKLSNAEKNQFVYYLKHESPMRVIKDYPSSKCIFNAHNSFLKFVNDGFVLKHIKQDSAFNAPGQDVIDGCLYTYMNREFIQGEYQISDATKSVLRKITGGNPDSLKALAMLTAAACSNNLPLNKAIIIVADDPSYDVVDRFFRILFDDNVYTLKRSALKNINSFFSAYKDTLLMSGGAYIFKEDSNVNFSTVRNLVKSNFVEAKDKKTGTLRFKNKIPLIVLTKSKDYADKFGCRINSYTINVDKDFQSIGSSFRRDIEPLRQALALYGLKLLSNPSKKTRLPKNNAASIKTVVKEFAELYCKSGANKYTSKTELRDAFNKYLSAYYPALKDSPIAICNHFKDHGFKTVKRRSDKYDNPIWVIQGVEFNAEKFNSDIAPLININGAEKTEDKFDKAFSELLSSKIEVSVEEFNI